MMIGEGCETSLGTGRVFYFVRSQTTTGGWTSVQRLQESLNGGLRYGNAITMTNSVIFIGAGRDSKITASEGNFFPVDNILDLIT